MKTYNLKTCDFLQVIAVFSRRVFKKFQRFRNDNTCFDDTQRARITAVTLAFACASLQKRLGKTQVRIISEWACNQLEFYQTSSRDTQKINKAIKRAARFFHHQCTVDIQGMCNCINQSMPVSQRYDVLELCIDVSLNESELSSEQVSLLKAYSQLLELDAERFRLMVEKYISIKQNNDSDISLLLGIDHDMSEGKVKEVLNKEFRKWNARVTNQNPHIRDRADQMLKMITSHRLSQSPCTTSNT